MLRILGRGNSSNVQKILWCCRELSLPFEREDAGGPFGRTHDPDYLALNPNGLVPTVIDGDAVLWESNTILRYLAARYGQGVLWEPEPVRRALGERWMDWQLATLGPSMTRAYVGLIRTPAGERDESAIARSVERLHAAWHILERGLREHAYLGGERFGIADIAVGVLAYRWFNLPIDRKHLPAVEGWYAAISTRPAFEQHVAIGLS